MLCRWSGQPSTLVQLEGHGREALFDDIDLTRSVGWFHQRLPVAPDPGAEPGESIKAIKEQLRAVPHKGLGYGVLRYLRSGGAPGDGRAAPGADHLQLPRTVRPELRRRPVPAAGPAHRADPRRAGAVAQRAERRWPVYGGELVLRWTYSRERYDARTVNELARAYLAELQALIETLPGRTAPAADPVRLPAGATGAGATGARPGGAGRRDRGRLSA
ncbi:condensation domain-containing protein [Pseudomonas aeruginosa]|nr:condensation domain-containing protein [Pseudomonas aeruginosa]